ncbi:uncharacterized protein LOC143265481 [Megachile rotundata]|uniref:uncharacterized protein LOC143265481 n=1 Tax=Megachile rotundata TaxID=143995 RepID=UPI003FD65049
MSVHCEKTPKFSCYIFLLGTLILILDSYGPLEEFPIRSEEDHLALCRFYQLHLPQQAIQIALRHRPENMKHVLQQALTHQPRKYVIHFLLSNAFDEISKTLVNGHEDGNGAEDRSTSPQYSLQGFFYNEDSMQMNANHS